MKNCPITEKQRKEFEKYLERQQKAREGIKYKGYTIKLVKEALDDFYEVIDKEGNIKFKEKFYMEDSDYCIDYLKKCIDTNKSPQEQRKEWLEELNYTINRKE